VNGKMENFKRKSDHVVIEENEQMFQWNDRVRDDQSKPTVCFTVCFEYLRVSNFFNRPKTDKQYSRDMYTFLFALLVLVALVFTVRKTPQKLLNRDQTEEWKGWMQVTMATINDREGGYILHDCVP